ncbi:MAG: glycosyltransferase [Candidatus Moranbacteria bacterium]|nr:glycosyltransferase [Candidatus Moranbacteria bacterium]
MRIAIDIRKIGRRQTGDETYITNLIKNLARLDQKNQYFLCTDCFEGEAIAKKILQDLPENFRINYITPGHKMFWTFYALPKFLKAKKIDLVHVQYITPLVLPTSTKLITTIHDVSFKVHPGYLKKSDQMLLNFFIPKSLKKANHIITVSKFTKKQITNFFPKVASQKITTIYNGIKDKIFGPKEQFDSDKIQTVRNKYNLKTSYILNVGSLQPRKNIPALIKAFRQYLTLYPDSDTVLALAGEKGYHYDYRINRCLRDLVLRKRVRLLGYVKEQDLPILYAAASLYASPSIYEGFNLPLVEVMKSAVPIIASDLSCHGEIINQAGILVDPFDTQTFAQQIHKVLTNKKIRQNLIQKGLKRSDKFNWQTCAKKTLAVYRQVAST